MMTAINKNETTETDLLVTQLNTALGLLEFSVRPAASDENEFLFKLYCDTRRDEVISWGFDESAMVQFLDLQYRAQSLSYSHSFPQSVHLIIEAKSQPVGRILLNQGKSRLHLVDIAILSVFQNRGIGSVILKALQDFSRQTSLPVNLSVHLTSRVVSLYRRHGFTETGRDDVYLAMEWCPDND